MTPVKIFLSMDCEQGTLPRDEDIVLKKTDPILSSKNHMGISLRKQDLEKNEHGIWLQ